MVHMREQNKKWILIRLLYNKYCFFYENTILCVAAWRIVGTDKTLIVPAKVGVVRAVYPDAAV